MAEPALAGWDGPWNFQSLEATADRLERIGFEAVRTWRTEVHVRPDEPERYFATAILGSHLDRLAPERRAGFVHDVLRELGGPDICYVRLNISARRPT